MVLFQKKFLIPGGSRQKPIGNAREDLRDNWFAGHAVEEEPSREEGGREESRQPGRATKGALAARDADGDCARRANRVHDDVPRTSEAGLPARLLTHAAIFVPLSNDAVRDAFPVVRNAFFDGCSPALPFAAAPKALRDAWMHILLSGYAGIFCHPSTVLRLFLDDAVGF